MRFLNTRRRQGPKITNSSKRATKITRAITLKKRHSQWTSSTAASATFLVFERSDEGSLIAWIISTQLFKGIRLKSIQHNIIVRTQLMFVVIFHPKTDFWRIKNDVLECIQHEKLDSNHFKSNGFDSIQHHSSSISKFSKHRANKWRMRIIVPWWSWYSLSLIMEHNKKKSKLYQRTRILDVLKQMEG